jgi:hypothetical protein
MTDARGARERALDELLAKDAIRDVLCRYCHGIDRCDVAMLRSAYWPDGHELHGTFNGYAWEFAEYMTASMRANVIRSQQHIGNALIQVDPDGWHARGETYVICYMQVAAPEGRRDLVIGGRYLDRFERRGDEWRILDRVYALDWNQNVASTDEWETGIYDLLRTRGARSPEDPWDRGLPERRVATGG